MLDALVRAGAPGVVAILHDDAAAEEAHMRGVGSRFQCSLGGKCVGHSPFNGELEVVALGDGAVKCFGAMMKGVISQLGPTALIRIVGSKVRVVVSSNRVQALDRAYLRHVGVQPEAEQLLVLKSSVHFRAEFAPIARRVLVAAAPGENGCRLERLPFRRLLPHMRLGPCGAAFGSTQASRLGAEHKSGGGGDVAAPKKQRQLNSNDCEQ